MVNVHVTSSPNGPSSNRDETELLFPSIKCCLKPTKINKYVKSTLFGKSKHEIAWKISPGYLRIVDKHCILIKNIRVNILEEFIITKSAYYSRVSRVVNYISLPNMTYVML